MLTASEIITELLDDQSSSVSKIISKALQVYLTEYNYDGLYNPDGECACLREALAPCGHICSECMAGYLLTDHEKRGESDFWIGERETPEESDKRIAGETPDSIKDDEYKPQDKFGNKSGLEPMMDGV